MYRLLRKGIGLIAAVALFINMGVICAFARPDWPSDVGVAADAGILFDMDSKAVLYGQNIHVPYAPASITKLLTALVVAENCSMDDMVEFSRDAVYNVEEGSGNKLNLTEGDKLTVRDSLYVMLLQSSNQAANALAEHTAGSREKFVGMMNDKIREIGCTESNFANPSGLNDENQYVTAYDMALIAQAAFENEDVMKISSSRSYSIPATINNPEGASFRMEHRILITSDPNSVYFCEGAAAGKTGYTSIAGNTLVTCAKRDGRRLISVVLKGKQPQYYIDAKSLLDFGFSSFKNVPVAGNEKLAEEQETLEINGAACPTSELTIDEKAVVTLPVTADFSNVERQIVTELPSGHPENAVAMLQYTYNERKIGNAYLYSPNPQNYTAAAPGEDASAAAEGSGAAGVEGLGAAGVEGLGAAGVENGGDGEGAGAGNEMQDAPLKSASAAGTERETSGPPGGDRLRVSWKVALTVPVLLAAAAAAFLILRERKREREEMERRRARRRQRILESGCSEEEFETLLQERYRAREEKISGGRWSLPCR